MSVTQRPLIHCNSTERVGEHLQFHYVNAVKQLMQEKASRSKEAAVDGGDDVLFEYLGHREYIDTLQVLLFHFCIFVKKNAVVIKKCGFFF